jgi:hypothetical protein
LKSGIAQTWSVSLTVALSLTSGGLAGAGWCAVTIASEVNEKDATAIVREILVMESFLRL